MKFLHISDLHLGKTFSSARGREDFARLRRQELLGTFSRVVDYANENQVDFILCCGDFLNSEELQVKELRNINANIKRLEHTVLIAISGNHDPQCENSAYNKIEWDSRLYLAPVGVGRVMLSSCKAAITCHSWDKKEMPTSIEVPTPSSQNDYFQILMMHADTTSPESCYLPMDADKLSEAGFDYVALGHIHKMQKVAENVYYSGSLEPLDRSETGEHGFMQVEVSDDGTKTCTFVPFAQRQYRELSIQTSIDDSEVQIAERIAQEISVQNPQDIYTVTLTGTHPAANAWQIIDIEEDLRHREYFCTVEDDTRPDYDLKQLAREHRGTLIGDFIESFSNKERSVLEEKALQYGLEALMTQRKKEG